MALTQEEMARVIARVFTECSGLRAAGQKEYAHAEATAFGNFERVAKYLQLSREKVLLDMCLLRGMIEDLEEEVAPRLVEEGHPGLG